MHPEGMGQDRSCGELQMPTAGPLSGAGPIILQYVKHPRSMFRTSGLTARVTLNIPLLWNCERRAIEATSLRKTRSKRDGHPSGVHMKAAAVCCAWLFLLVSSACSGDSQMDKSPFLPAVR